jgi:hypothetical protein
VTLVTSLAIIHIAADVIVLICQVSGVVVLVAIDAAEKRIIPKRGVAIRATVPFAIVLSGIDREVQIVVLIEARGVPSGVGGVTNHTILREARSGVVRIVSRQEVVEVTADTFRRRRFERFVEVAVDAGRAHVPTFQRKKSVEKITGPIVAKRVMARGAIGAEP